MTPQKDAAMPTRRNDGLTHYYGCEEKHKECGEARFLREVERRAGATREEILLLLAKHGECGLTIWLRRILGEKP